MPDTEKLSTQAEQSEDPTKDLGVGRDQRAQDTEDIKNQEKDDEDPLKQEKKDNPYEQFLDELEKELTAHTDEATAKNFIETNRKVLVEEASLQLNLDLNPFVKYLRRCSKEEITLFSKKEESYLKIHNNFTKGNLKNKDLEDSQFWLIHNLDWLQSADSDYYLKVWDWCEDINLDKIKKLAIDDYKLESLRSLSDEQLLKNVRRLTLNKTVFEDTFKSTDVSIVELKSSNLNITGAAKSSKVSSGHEVYKSFLDGLANPKFPVDINTGRLKVNTELQSKQDCDYLCQIFVDANLGSPEEQKEISSDKNKLKISQEILKDLKKDGKLPKEAEKKLADVGIKVEESISYMTKLNDLENFLNENLDTEGEESMTEYKYLAHDDAGQIKDKVFDKFEDAYDYCQDGLVTFISELVYEDGQEDEDLEEVVWSWDDTHDRDEAIKSVASRHETVEDTSENPEVTEEKPAEDVEFKAAAVEADNPVDFLNQIAKELGVEDEIKVVEVEPAESKFGLSDIPDVEFPEDTVTVDADIPEDAEKVEDHAEDKLEDDELDEAKNSEDNLVNPGIKCDQELKGTDNAVIKDKDTKVVTHSEDERKTLNEEVKEDIDLNLFKFDFENPEYTKTVGEEDISLDFYEDYYGLLAGKVYGTLSLVENEDKFDVIVRDINLTTVEFEDESKLGDLDRKALEDKVIKEGTEYLKKYFKEDELLEDTHLKHAKTSEDPDERLIAYNAAVKKAHEENRGIVYGYTSRYSHGKWIPIELEPFTNRQDFEAKHHDVQTMLVAYPDDDFVEAEDKKDYKKLESCLSEAIQLEDEE